MMIHHTKKQHEIMLFIAKYYKKHGINPTLQEIADHQGIKVPTTHEHLQALASKGAISWRAYESRSMTILDPDFLRRQQPYTFPSMSDTPICDEYNATNILQIKTIVTESIFMKENANVHCVVPQGKFLI